ncbi:hypothetical protein UFOVP257_118 [uncultured Caudovirales phage]|uniref:Uncharacterized protein n=1 Tax=uncultured Caudovirales phage TaxID=2100421 RepID=A0A6J5LJY3_9CAUD|nr:hypothetical protein UFOVP257_118 [uncultured Caudovirales phage]
MAALNFPTENLVAGVTQYTSDLGTTYIWDGVKWVGHSAGGAVGTNSIQNSGYTVQVDAGGNLVLPAYTLPNTEGTIAQVLTWPQIGTVLEWRDQVGGGSGPSLGNFTFDGSTLHIPVIGGGSQSYLNAGGVGTRNSVQLRTNVQYVNTDINTAEIALEAGNGGFSAQVTGHWTGGADGSGGPTLVYAGVENVSGSNGPGFAGMVAIDPGVTSQYAVAVDEGGKIYLNVGGPVTTTQYTAALGVLTSDINGETGQANLNGIAVTPDFTAITGKDQITMSTDRGLVLFGNKPEHPTVSSHWHIMPADSSATDLFFGNDTNYVKLPRGTGNVVVGAGGPEWLFDVTGNLTLPPGGYILNSEGNDILAGLGGGGAANLGNLVVTNSLIENTTGNTYIQFNAFNDPNSIAIGTNEPGNVQLYNGAGATVTFDSTGVLNLPTNGIQFPNGSYIKQQEEEGLILWQNDNQDLNSNEYVGLWYGGVPVVGAPNVSITAGSYNWATDDDNLEYVNYPDQGSDQGLRQINLDIRLDNDNILNWHFDTSGNLYLPADPAVSSVSGIVFGDGTVQTTAGGRATGDVTLSQLSTIADVEAGVELTINRLSPNWYSVYGDLNTPSTANLTISGSVTTDSTGNIYVLGSIVNFDSYQNCNNVFLKYNTEGELQWSRTWTDTYGMPCGSHNASMRHQPATAGVSNRDLIHWASFSYIANTNSPIAYVGTMDTDGDLVDGYGTARAPVQLSNVRIADVELGIGSNVYVVGTRTDINYTNARPFIAKVDLNTHTANVAFTVEPEYININDSNAYTNFFKAATHDGTALYAIGNYNNDDYYGYDWPILTKYVDGPDGYTHTYHLTSGNSNQEIWGEEVAYSTVNDAVYVLMNNVDINPNFGIIGQLAPDLLSYIWMRRIGDFGLNINLRAMEFDADGFIYVVGELYGVDNGEFVLIKIAANGDLVWQRKIGTTDGYEGTGDSEFQPPGWSSSSSIIIDGTDIVFTGVTAFGQIESFTIKYPTDGSLTGDFGGVHAVEYNFGFVDDWMETIADVTGTTIRTQIDGNSTFRNDVGPASLIATTKTLESGFKDFHWDMTNNHLYIPERKWTFGVDGSITLPNQAKLYEDEPGTLYISSKGGTSINYSPYDLIADVPTNHVSFSSVSADAGGVSIGVDKKLTSNEHRQFSNWRFRDNGGLQFPDGSTQYGAYVETEMALDGGSAGTVFNIIPRPSTADGGGSSSRHGVADPVYDGSGGNDYVLDGGGA